MGDKVEIKLKYNGNGIPPAIIEKIFIQSLLPNQQVRAPLWPIIGV
jgi:hypothetical protein